MQFPQSASADAAEVGSACTDRPPLQQAQCYDNEEKGDDLVVMNAAGGQLTSDNSGKEQYLRSHTAPKAWACSYDLIQLQTPDAPNFHVLDTHTHFFFVAMQQVDRRQAKPCPHVLDTLFLLQCSQSS